MTTAMAMTRTIAVSNSGAHIGEPRISKMISGMKETLPAYSSVRRVFMITGQKIFSLLKALAVSYIITAILLLVTAFLMYKLGLGETVIHLSIIIIHGISVFLGGFLTGKMVKEQKYIWGLMLGVCYVLVIGIVSFIMNGTIHISAGGTLTNVILCLAAGMLGGMLG